MKSNVVKSLFGKLETTDVKISELYPSEWAEANRVMTREVSPIPGPFRYENSPYVRGIVDHLDLRKPGNVFAVMKGAQIGMSTGLMEAGIGWIIANDPGNILFLVGHSDLVPDAVQKVEIMIASSGLRGYIGSNSKRARNNKTGDTDSAKEFPGGRLKIGSANPKELRNFSVRYGFIDDFESMTGTSEQSGSVEKLIDQRFAAYSKKKKLFYISTPELMSKSNIYPVYIKGDQCKYFVPCPCCNERITLEWDIESEIDGTKCGIVYDLDQNNKLVVGSTRYRCYKCNGEFTDRNKKELLLQGEWIPTAEPKVAGYKSFHISSLYAPIYMDGWEKYVNDYLEACPPGGERDEEKYKTFVNLCLGLPYETQVRDLDSKQLMRNQRAYHPCTIPESISIEDGNGRILMITMGVDIGGNEEDARLDYEIVAWSESGASYSIDQGSIGTYMPKTPAGVDRLMQPMDCTKPNNVWDDLDAILSCRFERDNGKGSLPIFSVCVDTGYREDLAFAWYDRWNRKQKAMPVPFMIKGDAKGKKRKITIGSDIPIYRNSRSNPGRLFLLESNVMKTQLASTMALTWRVGDDKQPDWFMNFPQATDGKYGYTTYFAHFEAEEMKIDKNLQYVWEKRPGMPNHFFDCRLYAEAAREIYKDEKIFKAMKVKRGTWADFVNAIRNVVK